MAASLIRIAGGLPQSKSQNDDDAIDRLSHRHTCAILIIFSIVVTSKSYVGDPIHCWVPKHFSGPWTKYADSYCWVKGTHYVPMEPDVDIPKEHEEKDLIPYYQWIPIILLVQAFLFVIPCFIWRSMNSYSGIDVSNIIQASEVFHNTNKIEAREKTLKTIVQIMHRFFMSGYKTRPPLSLSFGSLIRLILWPICGRHKGNYLVALYLIVKLLYITNAIGQIFMLNAMLDTDFHAYGIDVLKKSFSGEEWAPTTAFPRVTMCDFKVRRLGNNIHRYVVQCALPVNLFNEKIFLIVWFWLVFVSALTCYSFLEWFYRASFRIERHRYIKKHLALSKKISPDEDKKVLVRFVDKYLGADGVMVLKLISKNTDAYTVVDIISELYDNYRKEIAPVFNSTRSFELQTKKDEYV